MDASALGQSLREAREAQEIALEDAVARLRIRRAILEAFEAGEFESTPMSDIQQRGLLRNYARYLALDEEQVLQQYDSRSSSRTGPRRFRRQKDQPPPAAPLNPMNAIDLAAKRDSQRLSILRAASFFALSLAAIAVIGFVAIELLRSEAGTAIFGDALQPGFITSTPPTATFTPPATASPTPPTPTPSRRSVYSGSGVLASIQINQRTWLAVQSDGREVFAGIAAPDTLLEYSAISEITLRASNAMALDIIWNGQQQGAFGGRGQQVDIRFTIDALTHTAGAAAAPTLTSPALSATATFTLTAAQAAPPAATPPPAATAPPAAPPTATPSPTATPTATPSPTATPTATRAFTPTATAVLPLRVTQAGLTPTKLGA